MVEPPLGVARTPELVDVAPAPALLRTVMGHYATGAVIVTGASHEGDPHGMAVNSFTSVSLDPPLILFCPAKSSETWPEISRSGHFAVNVLGAQHDELCKRFARRNTDRWEGTRHYPAPSGSPVLLDAIAYLDCAIEELHEAGDHYIALGRVLALGVQNDHEPLVFYQGDFRRLQSRV